MSSWSDLPGDILFLIVKKVISGDDFRSFSQVCASWRSIAERDRKQFRPVLPRIITKERFKEQKNGRCHRFESLSKLKLDLKLCLPKNTIVCGSHEGWIVVMQKTYPYMELTMINPISQVQFKLPFVCAAKIIFSANPMDDNCYIIAITNFFDPLKCCKLGDVGWTSVQNDEKNVSFGFVDAIFYRGKLYVLRKTGELFVCNDITASPPMMTKLVNTPYYSPLSNKFELVITLYISSKRFFLVGSGQELLLVHCGKMEVYRLDLGGVRWDRVANLGEHALFLGVNQSFSLSELDVRGIKGNHIYYIEGDLCESYNFTCHNLLDSEDESEGEKKSGKEICVFSLEKSRSEFLTSKFPLVKPGFWFMPHLGG